MNNTYKARVLTSWHLRELESVNYAWQAKSDAHCLSLQIPFYWNTALLVNIPIVCGCVFLQWLNRVAGMETLGSTKPKVLTILPFAEKMR